MVEHMTWTAFWVLFFFAWFFAGIMYVRDKRRRNGL